MNNIFPDDEITAYGFISHMEAYIKDLLKDPIHAQPDEYLKKHKIDGPKALGMLLKRVEENDPDSAILKRSTKIAPEKADKVKLDVTVKIDTNDKSMPKPKDKYHVKYSLPRKDYHKKMKNLFISMFESHIIEGCPINEEGEGAGGTMADMGGATTCGASSGQFIQPLSKKPIRRKTMYITQVQEEAIKKALNEESPAVVDTQAGDFGYDAPASICKKNDPTLDHKDMMKKSWIGEGKQGFSSMKLFNIYKKYGFKKYGSGRAMDLHNVSDDDVVGVFTAHDLQGMNIGQEKKWVASMGYNLSPADGVNNIELATESKEGYIMYAIVINRNKYYDCTSYEQEGGFKDYMKKIHNREASRQNDGAKKYQWKDGGEAEHNMLHNPFYKNWKPESKERMRQHIRNTYGK